MSNQPATVPRYATITVTREPDPALWQRQLGGLGRIVATRDSADCHAAPGGAQRVA